MSLDTKNKIIGITGLPLSGKNTAARIVAEKDERKIYDMGETVRIERQKRDIPVAETARFVNSQRSAYGQDIVAQMTVKRISEQPKNIVITGLRSLSEKERFEKELNAEMDVIAVWSNRKQRRSRMNGRKRQEDVEGQSLEKRDERDIENGAAKLLALSDRLVKNNKTIDHLENKMRGLM